MTLSLQNVLLLIHILIKINYIALHINILPSFCLLKFENTGFVSLGKGSSQTMLKALGLTVALPTSYGPWYSLEPQKMETNDSQLHCISCELCIPETLYDSKLS